MKIIFLFLAVLSSLRAYCNEIQLDTSIKKPTPIVSQLHPDDSLRCLCKESTPDAFTGNTVCLLPAQPLFVFTPESFRSYLGDQEFLEASIALAKNGKSYVLHLYLNIASEKAQEQFGDIKPHTFLSLELLKHKPVFCITHQGATAEIRDGKTHLHAIYTMDKQDAKLLSIGELSALRLHFTKGKRSFEIFDVDVIKRQFACF